MKRISFQTVIIAIAVMFLFASCKKNDMQKSQQDEHPEKVTEDMISENNANPDEVSITDFLNGNSATSSARTGSDYKNGGHYLYTESNGADGNEIIAYSIAGNGSLQWSSSTMSGGKGTGSPLGSQGAIALSMKNRALFAVNAGDNSVSCFKVNMDGSLTLVSTENSGGETPVSLSIYKNIVYVLNRGSDNIHGFRVSNDGMLMSIANSTMPLSGMGVDAPQISFSPDGGMLVVTEKATNTIATFNVNNDGSVGNGNFNKSVGNTPFGFAFARDQFLIVSNAEMGGANAGSGTSYYIGNNGKVNDINGARPNYQSAPCWVATTQYGRFAYMTNTATNNISSFYVAPWGGLYLIESEAAKSGMGPLDIVVSSNNYYVYALNSGSHSITSYQRQLFGKLAYMGSNGDLPAGATGLATF